MEILLSIIQVAFFSFRVFQTSPVKKQNKYHIGAIWFHSKAKKKPFNWFLYKNLFHYWHSIGFSNLPIGTLEDTIANFGLRSLLDARPWHEILFQMSFRKIAGGSSLHHLMHLLGTCPLHRHWGAFGFFFVLKSLLQKHSYCWCLFWISLFGGCSNISCWILMSPFLIGTVGTWFHYLLHQLIRRPSGLE